MLIMTSWIDFQMNGGVDMIFQPDEVTNLKKGRQVLLEIDEGAIKVLKRNTHL